MPRWSRIALKLPSARSRPSSETQIRQAAEVDRHQRRDGAELIVGRRLEPCRSRRRTARGRWRRPRRRPGRMMAFVSVDCGIASGHLAQDRVGLSGSPARRQRGGRAERGTESNDDERPARQTARLPRDGQRAGLVAVERFGQRQMGLIAGGGFRQAPPCRPNPSPAGRRPAPRACVPATPATARGR